MSDNNSESSYSDIENYSSDSSYEDFSFECPKCNYNYNNFADSNYGPCILCFNNYCKECGYNCDNCNIEICFRCSVYTECCDKNICTSCSWWCDECVEYCCDCIEKNICVNCEINFCKKHLSKEHKINVCEDCSIVYCHICSEKTYENPCIDCITEIEELLEENFNLPCEINSYILSYIKD